MKPEDQYIKAGFSKEAIEDCKRICRELGIDPDMEVAGASYYYHLLKHGNKTTP